MLRSTVVSSFASQQSAMRAVTRALARFGDPPIRGPLVVAVITFLITAVTGAAVQMPVPAIHDEFAYLLSADIFASGRFTEPTHPAWKFFESPYIIHVPSYQSKYPPGQALSLAAGIVLFDSPIAGVWVVYALACAAVCWMLQGYIPARWAFVGGLLCTFNPYMTHEWGQTYWGGGVAMLGGALFFGALPRLVQNPTARISLLLGVGLAILANSRPYEGAVAALLPAGVVGTSALCRLRRRDWKQALRMLIPAGAVLFVTAAAMMLYNRAVTGDPLKLPYQVWAEQYAGDTILATHIWGGAASDSAIGRKLLNQWEFFVRMPLTVPLLCCLWLIPRDDWLKVALVCCQLTLTAVVLQNTRSHPHYLAPVVAPLMLLLVSGLRTIAAVRIRRLRLGRACMQAILCAYLFWFAWVVRFDWIEEPIKPVRQWSAQRALIEQELTATGEQHLILVAYGPSHSWHYELVYNRANIDHAPVVWAHDLGDEKNSALFDYFPERRFWSLSFDRTVGPLTPLDRPRADP